MARGIVTIKPASTNSGKIMSTSSSASSSGGSTGSSGTATDPIAGIAALPIGTIVPYTQDTTANLGDVVDFVVADDGSAVDIKVFKAGTYLTGEIHTNVIVNAGDSVLVSAHVDGKIIVNGGMLTLAEGTHVEAKVESAVDGSYIFITGAHIEGRVAVAGASYLDLRSSVVEGAVFSDSNLFASIADTSVKGKIEATKATSLTIKNVVVDGKLISDGGTYTSVKGSTIKGKLEVINVTTCNCSGNTVDGKTITPGCTA